MLKGKISIKNLFKLDPFYGKNRDISIANVKMMSRLCISFILLAISYLIILLIQTKTAFRYALLIELSVFLSFQIFFFYLLYRVSYPNFKNIKLINALTYIFLFLVYVGCFIFSATITDRPAITIIVAIWTLPFVILIQPKISYAFTVLFTFAYAVLSYFTKSPDYYRIDIINCISAALISIALNDYYSKFRKGEFVLRDKYKKLSGLDELTGLQNRRQFNISYEKGFFSSINEKKTISLFLIDVDDFKNFNDYYGHLSGDECLKKIGACFIRLTEMRPYLNFYRYGGEEFIGIAYDLEQDEAHKIAAEIVESVKSLKIRHISSTVSDIITVSVGAVLQYPSIMSNSTDLINLADKALYKVKGSGKNGYIFY